MYDNSMYADLSDTAKLKAAAASQRGNATARQTYGLAELVDRDIDAGGADVDSRDVAGMPVVARRCGSRPSSDNTGGGDRAMTAVAGLTTAAAVTHGACVAVT